MPLLKTSASDFTSWVRSNAVLPTNGKAAKSTLTTVNVGVVKVTAIASKVAAAASPSTSILASATTKSNGNKRGD